MHPWHDVSPLSTEGFIHGIVEIPKGSNNKYELHKESGLLMVDRVLYSAVHYPANYGFIPRTYCDDNDPLDILIIGQAPIYPLCIMRSRPIGVMKMVDQGKMDDKIIAVHVDDPEYLHITHFEQLSPHIVRVVKQFFEEYKNLEQKEVKINSFLGPEIAQEIIQEAIELYQQEKTNLSGYRQCYTDMIEQIDTTEKTLSDSKKIDTGKKLVKKISKKSEKKK